MKTFLLMTIGLAAQVLANDECCSPVKGPTKNPSKEWICGDLRKNYTDSVNFCLHAIGPAVLKWFKCTYSHNRKPDIT